MKYLFLDDKRTPVDIKWSIARNYKEFVYIVDKEGLENFKVISLDHDLADFKRDVLNYNEFIEKTGMDCAKYLVNKSLDDNIPLPQIYVHSDNNVGSENIVRYINNYLKSENLPQTCVRANIPYIID